MTKGRGRNETKKKGKREDLLSSVCKGQRVVDSLTWRGQQFEHAPCPGHDSATCRRFSVHLLR